MLYLLITLLVVPSPVLMMISSEAIAITLALQGEPPLLIAGALSLGQTVGFSLLYLLGDWASARSERLQKGLKRLNLERLRERASLFISLASLFGLPPLNVSCVALSTLRVPYLPLLPLIFSGRFARYLVIASVPAYFAEYIDLTWLPDWLTVDGH